MDEKIICEFTPEELDILKKALQHYHYELTYRLKIVRPNPEKYTPPIDNYLTKLAEGAEQILLELQA